MAIADVAEYAHLSDTDLEALGVALEAIRREGGPGVADFLLGGPGHTPLQRL
jgi:hypothetical protein